MAKIPKSDQSQNTSRNYKSEKYKWANTDPRIYRRWDQEPRRSEHPLLMLTFYPIMQIFQIYIFSPLFRNIILNTFRYFFKHQRHNKTFFKTPLELVCTVLRNHTFDVSNGAVKADWKSTSKSIFTSVFNAFTRRDTYHAIYHLKGEEKLYKNRK